MQANPSSKRWDESGLAARRASINCAGLRVGAVLAATLVPLFSILDRFVIPDHFEFVLLMRLSVAAFAIFCFASTFSARGRRFVSALSVSLFTSAGIIIAVMIYLDEGYRSSYYAGLMLVVLATGVLFRWNWLECASCYGAIYVAYSIPGFIQYLELRQEEATLIGNNFFLASTIIIVCVAQYHAMQQLRREYRSYLDLLTTKASLETACADLKEMDRLKSRFFSNVTHELRTPLTMILAPLEILSEEAAIGANSTRREYLHTIQVNALRLLKLINDLLDLARIDERFLQLRPEQARLSPLLHEIIEYAQPLAGRKGITLELFIDEPAGEIFCDLDKLERVIVNLLANALKFTEPGGTVSVWTRELDDEMLVGVRDNGRGIPIEAQRWIFTRFHQADESVTQQYGGTGIGLALAKEIVELHGGHITLESSVGQGSNFVIHLPRGQDKISCEAVGRRSSPLSLHAIRHIDGREPPREWTRVLTEKRSYRFLDLESATERRLAPRGELPQIRATKVLVVEDNREILRFLSLQLRDQHAVYLAPDGEHGLALARSERPDVIICDYMMPNMDGVSLIKELRRDPETADTPVIMLTAKNLVSDRLAARDAGADVYLSKPFSPAELRLAVSQLLERRGRQVTVVVREQVKSLEVISAGFAHEIHNPLSYLSNAIHVIGEKLEDIHRAANDANATIETARAAIDASRDKTVRMLRIARTGVARIEQVVDLVRRYTRAGSGRESVPMPLDDLVREVSRLIIPPDGREVHFHCDLATSGARIKCVPGELEQVIRNLLQNAFEAVPAGGTVTIRTRVDNGWAVCEVCDDGPGMTQDVLSRIFTPFFTTKAPGRGMGLGLAISHQLVAHVGGDIAVESEVDQGTVFRVRLPVCEEHEQPHVE